jgi:hypothetical protein
LAESGKSGALQIVDYFRFIFAYTQGMKVTGYERSPDWPKLGPSFLIAAVLVVAIRTAKWSSRPPEDCGGADIDHELDQEVRFAERVTFRVMHELLSKHEGLFPQKRTPVWEATDEGVPK